MKTQLLAAAMLSLLACSSGTGSVTQSGNTSGTGSLAGTWAIKDPVRNTSRGTVVITGSGFMFSTPDGEDFVINTSGDRFDVETREQKGELTQGRGTRTSAGTATFGAAPFSFAGGWNFVNPNRSSDVPVVASFGPDAWSIGEVGAAPSKTWKATRTSSGSSIFGDLGGSWSLKTPDTDCTVSLLGNNARVICTDDQKAMEELNLTFDVAAGLASGRSRKEEILATKQL